jgi:hypothetical protein
VDRFRDLAADRLYVVEEGAKDIQAFLLPSLRKA